MATNVNLDAAPVDARANLCVTVAISGQKLAIPIARVEDIFTVQSVTPVPLAPPHIAGLINLRGKVVTGILLSKRLGLPQPESRKTLAISVGIHGETIGLLVPNVGDVIDFPPDRRDPVPPHLQAQWAPFAVGVHQSGREIIIELNVESIIALTQRDEAA
ncbi:chemotaxis protein CheW [Terrarubrum flagellatum]|uniref:chemotaxis protein CheW n=1 Tax=Terrirubrum flagellatum TaxID=2895980 RepID=UPI003144F85A